jgi:membrane protein
MPGCGNTSGKAPLIAGTWPFGTGCVLLQTRLRIMAGTAALSPPRSPASTLWTIFLGLALIGLVTARRREPLGEVVFGDRRGAGRQVKPGEKAGKESAVRSRSGAEAKRVAASEKDRGRAADKPTEIPAKGWKDVAWRVYQEMSEDRLLAVAAGVTFYALLAIFPGIAALVSLYGLFADATTINDHLATMAGVLPQGALDIIAEQVKRIASQGGGTLGFAFFFGLAISLWSANAGMKAIFDALNIVYEEEEKRSFIKLNMVSLLFTLGALTFLLLAMAAVVVLPAVFTFLHLGEVLEPVLNVARWPLLLVMTVLGLAFLYRYGPSRDKAEWRWITPDSIFAAVFWLIGSMLFSWYAANFGSYNETYGSLGAAIGFMTWIWLSSAIVLIGGEINAEAEHQTAKDTTTGAKKPLGARGAKMADQVAEAKPA